MRAEFEFNKRDRLNNATAHFANWYEFVKTASQGTTDMEYSRSSLKEGDVGFYGSASMDESVERARNGWDEGTKRAREMSEGLISRITSMVEIERFVTVEDDGLFLDMARLMDGEPDFWMESSKTIENSPGRTIIRIVYNVAASCGVDKGVMLARGAAVAALVYCLELGGYGSEVVLVAEMGNEYKTKPTWSIGSEIMLKPADQPCDLVTLSVALANAATLRRFGFSIMEQAPEEYRTGSQISHYGYPVDYSGDQGDCYIGKALFGEVDWKDQTKAIQWVLDEARKQGVEVN